MSHSRFKSNVTSTKTDHSNSTADVVINNTNDSSEEQVSTSNGVNINSSLSKQHKHEDTSSDYDGERISLTFRTIATYLHHDGVLQGQGAPSPPAIASGLNNPNINNDNHESVEMLNLWPKDILVYVRERDTSASSDPRSRQQQCVKTQLIQYNRQNATREEVLAEKTALLHAFRTENITAGFVWEDVYARGFSVW